MDTCNIGGIKQSKDKKKEKKESNTTHKSKKMSNMEYQIVYLLYIFNIKYMSWVMSINNYIMLYMQVGNWAGTCGVMMSNQQQTLSFPGPPDCTSRCKSNY